jgi:glycosyltransferase involved in cell wall biosynthesis
LKILHVVASYLPATRYGGPIVSVHGLCKALAARGHDVHVFTTSVDGAADSNVPYGQPVAIDGVTVWYFQSSSLRRIYYAPGLRQALRDRVADFDIVHSHGIYLWPLWMAGKMAARAGVPHFISPRGMLEKELIDRQTALWKSLLIAFVEKQRLESAAAIHVTSRRERDEALQFGFNFAPFVEVPNGVDVDVSEPALAPSPAIAALAGRRPFALFLGRINWKKGLDRLVTAMRFAPSAALVIAGGDDEGYRRHVEAIAESLGVANRVIFTGEVLGGDKRALIDMASVVVLPSYSENFGNVILEAWAQSQPVVVSPEVGLADTVRASGGGWVAGSSEEIGLRIEAAATDRAVQAQAGAFGHAEVRRCFSWDAVAAQMEAAYARAGVRTS